MEKIIDKNKVKTAMMLVIVSIGKQVLRAVGGWKYAGIGYLGSDTTDYYNGNGNPVKRDKVRDKVRELLWDRSKVKVIKDHYDGGYVNIDFSYGMNVSSRDTYSVDLEKYLDLKCCDRQTVTIYTINKTELSRKKIVKYVKENCPSIDLDVLDEVLDEYFPALTTKKNKTTVNSDEEYLNKTYGKGNWKKVEDGIYEVPDDK